MDLKRWINPNKNLKAQLLYRLSENGEKYETFHELCDKKGPTLTLFHIKENGDKIGIYTPLSWDKNNYNKEDMETFIFNLRKKKKYQKVTPENLIYCRNDCGPYTGKYFDCNPKGNYNSMKFIYCDNRSYTDNYQTKYYLDPIYEKGHEILSIYSKSEDQCFELIEAEVFKIIIE